MVETGSHPASIAKVAAGEADAASVDCLTYVFLRDHRPDFVSGVRVIAETPASPAIPFVTSAATPEAQVAALRAALLRLGSDPAHRDTLAALRIRKITPADPDAYAGLLDYEREAAALGYADLA